MPNYRRVGADPVTGQMPPVVESRMIDVVTASNKLLDLIAASGGLVRAKVVKHGDSLIQNWGLNSASLATSLGRQITNTGIGGQGTRQIAARQGGNPVLLTVANNTIPASGPVSVTTPSPNILRRPSDGNQSITGVLAGVPGVLSLVQSGNSTSFVYTFTRTTPGVEMVCPAGSPFATGFTNEDAWPIIWTGRNDINNGVFSTPKTEIVDLIKKMLSWSRAPQRALILSVLPRSDQDTNGTTARTALNELNDSLRTEFPTAFFDIATWLRTDAAFAAAEIAKTAQDITDISAGLTPTSFRSDVVHLNAIGYKAVNAIIPRVLSGRDWDVISLPPIGTIPTPDPEAHSNGVAGATHRYVPGLLATTGDVITTVDDLIGSVDLVAGTNTVSPTIAEVSGNKVLRWGETTNRSLSGTVTLGQPITIAVVAKASRPSFILAQGGGYRIARATDGSFALSARNAADTATGQVTRPFVDDYVVAFAVIDSVPANSRLAINSTSTSDAGTIGAVMSSYLSSLQIGSGSAQSGTADIAEVNVWPKILTEAERAAHITAMKAKWTMLPA